MSRYKIAFFIALTIALLLGGAVAYLWYHPRPMPVMSEAPAKASATTAPAAGAPQPSESEEPKLLPVQLTPQRMQSIGVKTGLVEFKALHDAVRTTGN